jgi:hypothetical protein
MNLLRKRLLPALLLFLFLFLSLSQLAWAQSLETESSVDYTFGQVMRFHLQAESRQPIQAASLLFNTPDLANTYVVELDITPSRTLSLTHELSLTQVQLAPFTRVTYWWELTVAGRQERVPGETFVYADDRFQWQTISAGDVTAHWTDSGVTIGQTALDIAAQARPRLQTMIPAAGAQPVEIYIYPSTADLRSAMRLTGRDWVGADAQPELGVLLVTAVNPRTAAFDLGQSIPHELAHLLLYEATAPTGGEVPRWFEEGVATIAETAPNPDHEIILEEAVAGQATIPFASLCETFPAEEDRARLAYAQSASFVRYIQARYGNEILGELVLAFADGAGCETATRRVLDVSLDRLNADWLETVEPLTPLGRFWQVGGLWLLLLGGGFGLMLLLLFPVRRHNE